MSKGINGKVRPKLRFTLGFKFVGVLVIALIPLMLCIGIILINQVKQVVTDDISRKSRSYADFLAKVGRQGVHESDKELLKQYIEEISANRDVLYLLITDKHNKPILHSERTRGKVANALEVNIPIYYKGERAGVVKIWYSFSSVAEELTYGVRNVLFLIVGLCIILLGLLMFFVSEQMVFRRIDIIVQAMKRVQKGDLSTRIEKLGNDELGFLADQFNTMVTRVEENQRELTLLFEVSRAVTAALDITLITEMVIEAIVEKLQGSSCCIFLVNEKGELELRGSRGLSAEFINSQGLKLLEDTAQKALMYGENLIVDNFDAPYPHLHAFLRSERVEMVISMPLIVGDRKLGVLNINTNDREDFPPERIELLSVFARQLAVAIQNAQLYERIQQFSKELEDKIEVATLDLGQANEQLKFANEKLRVLSQAKSEFITIVSHELRSPLTSVLGFTDLLSQGETGILNETQKEFIEIINQNTKRQIDLINNLLNLSKIEAGKVELKKEWIDLEKLVHGVVHNFRFLLLERNLEVKMTPPPETLPKVHADEGQISLVVTNLLTNALKYANPDGEVAIQIHREGPVLQLDIYDTGEGIDDRDLPHIFERFFRSSKMKAKNIIGTGLGLTISKSIIEMHGGRIWVQSPVLAEGKAYFSVRLRNQRGTKFSFTLPVGHV